MSTPTDQAPAVQNPSFVSIDAWCNACGYNLLGRSFSDKCPKCGTSIEHSIESGLLENAPKEHVTTLHKGVSNVLDGILFTGVALVVWAIVHIIFFSVGLPGGGSDPTAKFILGAIAWGRLAIAALILRGWWQFCDLDPTFKGRNLASYARIGIRSLLVVTVLAEIAGRVLDIVAPAQSHVAWALTGFGVFIWCLRFFFEMSYIRWLAPRLPSDKAAARARRLTWLGPTLFLSAVLFAVFGIFVARLLLPIAGLMILTSIVLYWRVLDAARTSLIRIEERHAHAKTDPDLATPPL